ncbi:hypothetical protein FE374_08770 [Georgenia yuyongxinii]|uniref:DUF4386 family protein n=1 Tax=Georgenia yuyongxinii TaxID=2589797 RepID=A0A5B8C6A2_9MICO|nr:hypothetical protein [Georgenia yuyongxinii]QDC24692.1 hypothetical protein FE374_08770 [Georgenia yuyongxinii]
MTTHTRPASHPTTQHAADRGVRIAGMAGMTSVAAMAASFVVLPADPGGTSAAAIAGRYADGSAAYLTATLLETVSIGLLCLFVAGVCAALWARRPASVLPVAAAIGGTMLATCQLVGYAVIASLAHGTAAAGDLPVIMAVYDLSSVFFVVANVGLAILGGSTGVVLLTGTPRARTLGWSSLVMAAAGIAGAAAHARDGLASLHGDLGFLVLLTQLAWTAAASVWLLRPAASGSA